MSGERRQGEPITNCAEAWKRHRRYWRVIWGLIAGWLPYGVIMGAISLLWPRLPFNFLFAATIPYFLALIVVSQIALLFRCPRCASHFYARGPLVLGQNAFTKKCRNCGLPKWQCDVLE